MPSTKPAVLTAELKQCDEVQALVERGQMAGALTKAEVAEATAPESQQLRNDDRPQLGTAPRRRS